MPRKPSNPETVHFNLGERVRVKHGVRDPDFPDVPLGGWAGTIKEANHAKGENTYLVEWSRATLGGMHPVYRKRCERDGLELETMWLGEDDLEPDDDTPLAIDQPTKIVTKSLSEKDQDDRVRMVFGLTHDDPLPGVNHKTLLAYHRYLSKHLSFPFKARYEKPIGWSKRVEMPVTVTGLLRADECEIDEQYGIIATGRDPEERVDFPLADVKIEASSPRCRMVGDYAHWFHHWR